MHNGLGNNLSNLYMLSKAKTRAICAENPTGGKGMGGACKLEDGIAQRAARDLGTGWKVNPYIRIPAGGTAILADVTGSGAIQHIWCTAQKPWRNLILRIYWDGQVNPSVECPLGDFFACGWGDYAPVVSQPVCVNPGYAFNCFWEMPYRKGFKMTLENRSDDDTLYYYQVDYCETEVPEDVAYFHAQFRRNNPLPYGEVYTLLDGVKGQGQYVGTYINWGVNNNGWWGEGEIKFFIDGDGEFPTICGTGTEDYFLGSYNFENQKTHEYEYFSTPFAGLTQITLSDQLYQVQRRFGMYRWHIPDPIRFEDDLKVTIQALGWRSGGRYLPLQDDISSVAFWYQTLPAAPFPALGDRDALEII